MCTTCELSPCACKYMDQLLQTEHESLLEVADAMADEPQPHRGACPCPVCWSARAATWGDLWVEERSGQR